MHRKLIFISALSLTLQVTPLIAAESSELYYDLKPSFRHSLPLELQMSGGYDFSRAFLWVYSVGATAYWVPSELIALGGEFNVMRSGKRETVQEMEAQLKPYGFPPDPPPLQPQWNASLVMRFTPLSGLINLLSLSVFQSDLSLVARLGDIHYSDIGFCPWTSFGLELALAFSSSFGVHMNIDWGFDKPPQHKWISGVAFRLGPVIRL